MYWIDLLLLGVLAFCAFLGLTRGFINEALGLLALCIATFAALAAVDALFPVVEHTAYAQAHGAGKPAGQNVIKIAIYLTALGFAAILPVKLSSSFGDVFVSSESGSLSRLLGAVLGFIKGGGYIVAAYLLAEMVVPPANWPQQWSSSKGLPAVYAAVRAFSPVLPENMRPDIQPPFVPADSP